MVLGPSLCLVRPSKSGWVCEDGATLALLSQMKCPIVPPLCQQAAVPQWKTAHFEQYLCFVSPPPHSVLIQRHIIPIMPQPHKLICHFRSKQAAPSTVCSFIKHDAHKIPSLKSVMAEHLIPLTTGSLSLFHLP